MITTNNLTIQFGEKPLFENISTKFKDSNRYGLIGANGSGKSTFMKILSSDIKPSSGNIIISEGQRLGVLSQDQFAFETYSLINTVIQGYPKLWEIKKQRDEIYAKTDMSEEDGIKVSELEVEFGLMDGYSAESKAGELLLALGIDKEEHHNLMSTIAPGWKLRVLLAQALFSDPDILLLDEPTNNLDITTIRWLEKILNEKSSLMIIISHDRHFLNSVCTHIADLDYGELTILPGNYDDFMIAKTAISERAQAENAKKKVRIKELQAFVSRFSANASKAKQATSRARQIDKIQLEELKPSSRVSPYIRFEQGKKLYRVILEVENITKSFANEVIFKDLNLILEAGDRLAVIGTNGIGKTTLIKTLINEIKADSGSIKWSENSNIGYFAQDHNHEFIKDISLFDWMSGFKNKDDDEQKVRSILGKMLFSKNEVNKSVTKLSGGEKVRMIIGRLMLKKANILVIDEPTNHLDMESIEALNLALINYQGSLIFVSHDREFVSSLATKIVELKPNTINYFSGSYDEYLKQINTK